MYMYRKYHLLNACIIFDKQCECINICTKLSAAIVVILLRFMYDVNKGSELTANSTTSGIFTKKHINNILIFFILFDGNLLIVFHIYIFLLISGHSKSDPPDISLNSMYMPSIISSAEQHATRFSRFPM